MIHPLLHLVATQPQLLAEHVAAYAELAGDGVSNAISAVKWRLALNVAALGLVAIAATLGGVALMLWAVTPPGNLHAGWALIAAPLLPLFAAAICLVKAQQPIADAGLAGLKKQFNADLDMLREVGAA